MFTERSLRLRALRAALAVTVGSVALTGCSSESGSSPETDVDSATDSATDVAVDTAGVDSGDDDDVSVAQDGLSSDVTEDAVASDDTATVPDSAGDASVDPGAPDADVAELDSSVVEDVLAGDTVDDVSSDGTGADDAADVLPDPVDDVSGDVMVGVDVDGDTGVPVTCRAERDEQCPMECTRDNDVDCCDQYSAGFGGGLCFFDPSFGCGCAVEGPFAPPSLPARRPRLAVVQAHA